MGHTLDTRGKPLYNDDATDPGPQGDFQAAVDFADEVGGVRRMLAADRETLTSAAISIGEMVVETDTGRIFKRNAAADWDLVWAGAGMSLLTPSGVSGSGVSIGPDGEVVLSSVAASTTLQLRGIFSPLFDHYRIYAKATTRSGLLAVSGIIGTSAIGGSAYSWTRAGMVQGSALGNNQATLQANLGDPIFGDGAGTIASSVIDILSPNLAEPTQFLSHIGLLGGATGIINYSGNLNSTDQLTGLQIVTPAAGVTTAKLRIYGVA